MSGRDLIEPPLPYDMRPRIDAASRDLQLQQFVRDSTSSRDAGRIDACRVAFGDDYDAVRRMAGRIKQHALDHLDVLLERFVDRATAAGASVHFARTAEEANAICVEIARAAGCGSCVKSKSMLTEEIGLVPALEDAGLEVVETDLGEFIIQLDDDAPSHLVAPMIHKNRESVGTTFARELGIEFTDDPETLTRIAREHLRGVFRKADLGISGANFLVAETGSVVVCTNEGNADLSVGAPRVQIAVAGIEKVVASLDHLGVLLKLLARSATAQPITVYTSVLTGTAPVGDEGPDAMHIVLVDNGRVRLLDAETRDLLRCIRCGACQNTCPVYRTVGGHAYGSIYGGPIGAVLTPHLRGIENYPDLPRASSLCGACHAACPVDIDIPAHLVRLREELARRGEITWTDRAMRGVWALAMRQRWSYRMGLAMLRRMLRARARDGWIEAAPGPLADWTRERDFPAPAARSFRSWWASRDGGPS